MEVAGSLCRLFIERSQSQGEVARKCIVLSGFALHNKEAVVPLSAVPDLGSAEQAPAPQKRKAPSPPHSSNGHSPSDTSPSPTKKKKKPGLINSNKDQVCSHISIPFFLVPM